MCKIYKYTETANLADTWRNPDRMTMLDEKHFNTFNKALEYAYNKYYTRFKGVDINNAFEYNRNRKRWEHFDSGSWGTLMCIEELEIN